MKKVFLLMLLVIICSINIVTPVFADSNDFSVSPILPNNQRSGVESYFDLSVSPNQVQKLEVSIKNNTSNTQKYKMSINTATTNQNGIVDYSLAKFTQDDSMKFSIKDYIHVITPEIDVPGNSQKEGVFELEVPSTNFHGILLGGLTIEPIVSEEQNGQISNIFTRTLAIQLSESDLNIAPEIKAGEVEISQENYRNNIKMEIRNITPVLVSNLSAKIIVTKVGEKLPILEQSREQLSFAPNSKFKLKTDWNNKFEPGKYLYSIQLSDNKGHLWKFQKKFEIVRDNAKKYNGTSLDSPKNHYKKFILYIIAGIIFICLLILALIYFAKKYRGKRK